MMNGQDVIHLCWPGSNLGECINALARKTRLTNSQAPVSNEASIEWNAKKLGCEAEPIETTFADLENTLRTSHPALLQLGDAGFLAILGGNRRALRVLTPDSATKRVALQAVCAAVRATVDQPNRPEYERLVSETHLSEAKQSSVVDLLLAEQIGGRRFDRCWLLRVSPGARPRRWLRQANTLQRMSGLIAAHSVQYLLWLASWAILGRLSFEGRLDRGWLLLWAVFLLAVVPFRVLTTWLQGLLAVGVGRILKRRLLWGALRLAPDEVRHQGIGSFLGQALEAEAVETLALSGGIAGVLAAMEIVASGFVLGPFAIVLALWTALTAAAGCRFVRRYRRWTAERMRVTYDLIESMVGHRTRLAQLPREDWHETEDESLQAYLEASRVADGSATALMALIPRGWLLVGLACLIPEIVRADTSGARIALILGGVLLAYNAFRRLTASFADVAGAWIAWNRVAPLFHAASRPENLGREQNVGDSPIVIEADGLTYSYRKQGNAALQAGSLVIRKGERMLLEGSSGGGKSTFASLLAGLRTPDSGLLLLHGLDRDTLGDNHWRKRVVAAPQFHENHILTETLAFNVLMGRGWPPTAQDLQQAEAMCRELGLGDLLERMPAGIVQMVGEGGWQLSHGERSRVFVARALLQKADLVILDESFAALDPENLKGALECSLQHAETLLVIAHP
jgi:ATP-binding cassette subfamily B protein